MIKPTNNCVIVKYSQKYIGNFTRIMKLAHIQNNSSIEPADLVNIVAEVVGVPSEIRNTKREYDGYSAKDIKVGDSVILSHLVIYDFKNTAPEEEPIFKNSFWYKDGEYFMAEIFRIYAVIRSGEIRMQNGYVMVENMDKPSSIYLPQHLRKKNTASATISAIEMNPELKTGDRIYYNPNQLLLYQINGKPFGILKSKQILGKDYRPTKDYPYWVENGTGLHKQYFDN